MVDARLIDYIRNSLMQGYRPEAVRAHLISQGYPQADVDSAINAAYRGEQPGKKKFFVLTAIIISLLFVGAGIGIFVKMSDSPSERIPHSDTPSTSKIPSTPSQVTTSPSKQPSQTAQTSTTPAPVVKTTPIIKAEPVKSFTPFIPSQDAQQILKDITSVQDCDALAELRDRCVLEFSWEKNDVSFCQSIIPQDTKDQCFSRYALRHENKEYCEPIDNIYSEQICDIVLKTAAMLREQGTVFSIDAKKGVIDYNKDQALKNLQSYAQQKQAELIRTQTRAPSVSANVTAVNSTPSPPLVADILANITDTNATQLNTS